MDAMGMTDFCPCRRIFSFFSKPPSSARLGVLGHAEGVHEAQGGGEDYQCVFEWCLEMEHVMNMWTDTSWWSWVGLFKEIQPQVDDFLLLIYCFLFVWPSFKHQVQPKRWWSGWLKLVLFALGGDILLRHVGNLEMPLCRKVGGRRWHHRTDLG